MFKQDLKDHSNRLLSWVGGGDCCNWTGVVCDNLTGHVRELHLGNDYSDEYLNYSLYQESSLGGKVTNTLPSMLVELHMSGCELNQIPVGVANMTRLKVVNLSSIGNLTAIVNLDLSANQIEGKMPNSLGNLCKLTVLDMSRNYFNGSVSEILGSLSRCSSGQMESPKLSTNDFSGPLSDQLGNLRHLRLLALSSNSVSGPIPMSLGNVSFLEEASISENHFSGTLPKTTGQLKMVTVAYVKSIAGRL
ncbi:hypothetical protein Pyn_18280 [Prunus yedoensis var. nudiflora]|uniref:Leucine-rich repeat-containing N-terminal plant-type domain-containing protein n=1 Tax=Prunus yedoensis var. nudiflora TaxID=2094558 RepID=A0A314ZIZ9_PRUYE|nr:hypothetical protein Pyn_18280 [Prunus yedoensis var. nudiflora]